VGEAYAKDGGNQWRKSSPFGEDKIGIKSQPEVELGQEEWGGKKLLNAQDAAATRSASNERW